MSRRLEDQIPLGPYCYDEHGLCPFWHISGEYHWQEAGYCAYMDLGDWEAEVPDDWPEGAPTSALSLLWDQVKECGVNPDREDDEVKDERRGTLPLRLRTAGSNCGMDDPAKLSMFTNRELIKALRDTVEVLTQRIHRLELKVLPPKSRNPWMGDPLPRK